MVGTTTIRFGGMFSSGDEAYSGSRKEDNPSSLVDIEWDRQVWTLDLYHQASARIGFGLTFPYMEQDVDNNTTGAEEHDAGITDISGYLLFAPWEEEGEHVDEFLSPHNISFLVGLSLPTGNEQNGNAPALHFGQLGSGSIDARVGVLYNAPVGDGFRAFAGMTLLMDGGPDTARFRNGVLTDMRIGASYQPAPWASVFVTFNFIVREKNLSAGSALSESGGTWWFVEIGGSITPHGGWFVDVSVAIPIYRNVDGTQPVTDEIITAGAGYRF